MIKNNIKNSSGKIIGYSIIDEEQGIIIVHNNTKPELIINDIGLILKIKSGLDDTETLQKLYDTYYLSIGEIASLYNRCYSNINIRLKKINLCTKPKDNRRNRSYGKPQSQQCKEKMSSTLKEYYTTHDSPNKNKVMSLEERKKISDSLKKYFALNPQNPEPHRKNWREGRYDNVDFHHGIAGYFYSIKNKQIFRFRSLLELKYMILLEEDINIIKYQYEPFHILCDNGTSYMPDFLIDNTIIELKSKKYITSMGGKVLEQFLYKKQQAENYANQHNMLYKTVYDEDIDFDSSRMKHYIIQNPDIVNKYQIKFLDEKRVYGH